MSNSGYNRSAQIPDARSHARLNIIKLHPVFVDSRYGNFFYVILRTPRILKWVVRVFCVPLGYSIHGDGDGGSYKATEIIIN
jgi:hypothetical protein